MKAKHGLFLLVMGFILTFVGALFKLESWPGSSEMLLAGMVFQVAGGVFLVYKIVAHPKVKDFLNR